MAVQIDGSQGSVIATSGTYSGGVSIGGTLTYEDVTNIDAVGLITARNGIEVGARPGVAASISVDGDMIISGISTFKDNIYIADKILHDGDGDTVLRFPAADTFAVQTGGSEAFRVDSSQRLLIGTTDTDSVSDGEVPQLISKATDSTAGAAFVRHSANAGGCGIYFGKSRNATIGSNTIVQDDDELGRITFSGDDGTNLNTQGAQIAAHVDGTPGENDMPGRLQFYTTPDGAANVVERMRIDSTGEVFIGDGTASSTTDRSTLLSISGAHQSPSAVWTQLGLYSNDSQAADKGGSIGFGGQDGSTTKQQFAAILGAKENGTSTNYAGYLSVYTRPAGSVSIERLRITSTGHMGLGVTPSAWPSNGDSRGLQVGTGACLFGRGSGDEDRGGIGVNYYNDGSGNKYIGNGHASRIYMNDGNIDFDYGASNSSGADQALSLTTHMRIATDGDVAIGHYSPSGRLDVRAASNNGRTLLFLQNDDTDNYGQLTIELGKVDREVRFVGGYSNNFMTFYTQDSGSSTERMRITDGGNVTIGKTSALGNGGTAGIELHAVSHYSMFVRSSNVPMFVGRNSTTGTVVSYLYNGTERGKVQTDGTVIAYNTSSDYRLKENEATLTNGIEKLKQLKPYTFNFKETPSKIDQGFFAHEVQTVVPGAVSGTKDAVAAEDDSERGIKKGDIDPQQMDYAKLTPLLTAALQEAVAKIEVLESEVAALKSS